MPQRLNYSKWEALEVSDDSDIEGHPNVDHKSLVRWKQRDIHEKRMQRNMNIERLKADIACNEVLKPRLIEFVADIKEKGAPYFSQLVERLKTQPASDKPPTSGPNDPSYDNMLSTLLVRVWEECKEEGVERDNPDLGDKLAEALQGHVVGITKAIEKSKQELEAEVKEKKKKITSDDITEGWDSKYVPAKAPPEPLVKPKKKKTEKTTTTEFETLNPTSSASPAPTPSGVTAATPAQPNLDDSDDDETPVMTESLRAFSNISLSSSNPASTFQASFDFIQQHPEVIVDGAVDALLLEAFSSQMKATTNKKLARYALQCVHQGLLLQYCEKLGKDGVRMFFKKMIQGDPVAIKVFQDDVQKTYTHIVGRAKYHAENTLNNGDRETIQLVVEGQGENSTITFNIPDGPPPTDLRLEGPGTEKYDIEEVRKALQLRWDIFSSFTPAMQAALKTETLDAINKVLANMEVPEAESVVEKLQMSGIMLFAEPGVRDTTGKEEDEGGDV